MVELKLWFQIDLFKATKVWLLIVALFVLLFLRQMRFFVIDHTIKLGMKDLLKAQDNTKRWIRNKTQLVYGISEKDNILKVQFETIQMFDTGWLQTPALGD